jgi:hypothetical protein
MSEDLMMPLCNPFETPFRRSTKLTKCIFFNDLFRLTDSFGSGFKWLEEPLGLMKML